MQRERQVQNVQSATSGASVGLYESSSVHKRTGSKSPTRSRKWLVIGGTLLGVVLLAIGGWAGVNALAYQGIDTNRYQAVYLDNNNVYFGKVHYMANGDVLLQDVFRVQAGGSTDTGKSPQSNDIRLIKPGSELHGPDDVMRINRGKITFIENLKTDGKVTQAIQDYKKGKSQ